MLRQAANSTCNISMHLVQRRWRVCEQFCTAVLISSHMHVWAKQPVAYRIWTKQEDSDLPEFPPGRLRSQQCTSI